MITESQVLLALAAALISALLAIRLGAALYS
jgi:photosystem I reaction center subunit XII